MTSKNKINTKVECPVYIKGYRCPIMQEICEYVKNVRDCPGYQGHFMPSEEKAEMEKRNLDAIVAMLGLKKLNLKGRKI